MGYILRNQQLFMTIDRSPMWDLPLKLSSETPEIMRWALCLVAAGGLSESLRAALCGAWLGRNLESNDCSI